MPVPPAFPSRRVTAILLVLIVAVGLWTRERHLAGGDSGKAPASAPALASLDAYFYLRLAQTPPSSRVDGLREFPAGAAAPTPLPLLSRVARTLHALGLPPDALSLWLPALLGALVAVPVHRLTRRLASGESALLAALFMAVAPVWVVRTAPARLDTDGLILLLFTAATVATVTLVQRVRQRQPPRSAVMAWLGALALLLWTWDQAPDVVCALFAALAGSVTLAAAAGRRQNPGWHRVPLLLAGAVAIAFAFAAWRTPLDLVTRILSRFAYLGQASPEGFATSQSVSELARLTPWEAVTRLGGPLPFALALAGWFLRLRRPNRIDLLPVLPALLLGLMGAFLAQRFLIFALPVWAAGIGFCALAWKAWPIPARQAARVALAGTALFLAVRAASTEWTPSLDAPARRTLARLGEELRRNGHPKPSLCWAWWDLGYPIQCLAGAATVTDGGSHPWTWLVTTARLLASTNPDRAADALRRLATPGANAESPHEDLARLLEGRSPLPPAPEPRHLFLDRRTARAFPWMLRMAAWNPDTGLGPERRFQPLEDVRVSPDGFLRAAGGVQAQLRPWSPEAAGRIVVSPAGNGLLLVANPSHGVGALMEESLLETLFVRLYYLDDANPADFSVVARDGSALLLRVEPRAANSSQ